MTSSIRIIAFYAVLVAPGFVAVMTAITLSAIEDDHSQFVLLVWSLVSSLIIDTLFLAGYQYFNGPITSIADLIAVLFDPYFRADYILGILLFSVVIGILYSVVILLDLQGRLRRFLQMNSHVTYNPRQPWENFMRNAGSIRIKTSDDQLYTGEVVEWSRADRDREVRIKNPHRYQSEIQGYEPVNRKDMLFLNEDIDRVLMRSFDPEITDSNRPNELGGESRENETDSNDGGELEHSTEE